MRISTTIGIALCLAVAGCGKQSDAPATTAGEVESDASNGGIAPCELLTDAQVATVLPGHSEGSTTHAGGSLIKGVDAYQCSYVDAELRLLTVILNVAADDARFDDIKPGSVVRDSWQPVTADGLTAWLSSEPNEVKVEAVKGRTVIDLDLMAPGAASKANEMTALAAAVAAKL